MRRNLATSLPRKVRGRAMESYDRLPPELRRWLANAALPWSAHSAYRIWARLQRDTCGDTGAILARLDRTEQSMLAKDGPRIWGGHHPGRWPPMGNAGHNR